ncbi:MAG: hypothetical protein ACRDQ0_06645 [Pseudonocardia sp.]
MAYTWITLTIPITAIDGLAHRRADPPDQPPALGQIPTVCGQMITPASITAPIGRDCRDCTLARADARAAARSAEPAASRPRRVRAARWWRKRPCRVTRKS